MKFSEMGLSQPLLESLEAMKFAEPTPIQKEAIPILLNGEDLIGQAQTGTGKTAAFGLPILENLLKRKLAAQPMATEKTHGLPQQAGGADANAAHHHADQNMAHKHAHENVPHVHANQNVAHQNAPQNIAHQQPHENMAHKHAHENVAHANSSARPIVSRFHPDDNRTDRKLGTAYPKALILVPTRELAVQVHANLVKMSGKTGARVVPIYGGVEMRKQHRMFMHKVEIIVGTPGRTLDHLRQGTLRLGDLRTVVLDEADRMLDMGFIKDVVKILDATPKHRQTILFSATMPKEISQIAHKYLHHPKVIKVSEDKLAVEAIKQMYIRATGAERLGKLIAAIRAEKPSLSLVFTRTKHEAKKLAQVLNVNGIKSNSMHGNLSQNAREKAIERFRKGEVEVMVATDLASRGIDVPGITHVFNYELPDDPMTYVHRIGRTARAGKTGTAITMIGGNLRHALTYMENIGGSKLSELVVEAEMPKMPERGEERHRHNAHANRRGHGQGGKSWHGNRQTGHTRHDGRERESDGRNPSDRQSHNPQFHGSRDSGEGHAQHSGGAGHFFKGAPRHGAHARNSGKRQ